MNPITETVVRKVLNTVDAGLCSGVGQPVPGKMCIEAVWAFVNGEPLNDEASCKHDAVRKFDITLNDSRWSTNDARAKGMRRLSIAGLGSTEIDGGKFAELVAIGTVQRIVPIALRAAASTYPEHAAKLEAAAIVCETVKTRDEAIVAAKKASQVAHAADTADTAYASAAAAAAYAASYAADAVDAVDAASYAASYAADTADTAYASAVAYAAVGYAVAAAADTADTAADTVDAAADIAAYATDAKRDKILSMSADIGCDALIECGSEGAKYLWLCDEAAA